MPLHPRTFRESLPMGTDSCAFSRRPSAESSACPRPRRQSSPHHHARHLHRAFSWPSSALSRTICAQPTRHHAPIPDIAPRRRGDVQHELATPATSQLPRTLRAVPLTPPCIASEAANLSRRIAGDESASGGSSAMVPRRAASVVQRTRRAIPARRPTLLPAELFPTVPTRTPRALRVRRTGEQLGGSEQGVQRRGCGDSEHHCVDFHPLSA